MEEANWKMTTSKKKMHTCLCKIFLHERHKPSDLSTESRGVVKTSNFCGKFCCYSLINSSCPTYGALWCHWLLQLWCRNIQRRHSTTKKPCLHEGRASFSNLHHWAADPTRETTSVAPEQWRVNTYVEREEFVFSPSLLLTWYRNISERAAEGHPSVHQSVYRRPQLWEACGCKWTVPALTCSFRSDQR